MRHWSCGISSGAAFILEIHFIHKSCIFVIYTNSLILWWNSSFSVNEPFKRSDNVAGFTLKCTWMWSRRTSTRKNLRPQISQVYFLSPWVNRCLFMLLLQENTCAHTQKHTAVKVQVNDEVMPWADACRRLTLLQMGQGDGSFLYLVPSSPLASSSSLFMCFGPVRMDFRFSLAKSVRANRRNPSKRCKNAPGCSALTWLSVCLCGRRESRILLSFMKSFTQWDSIWLPLTMPE